MGRYLAFDLYFPRETSLTNLLRPLFQSDFMQPMSVGGHVIPKHRKRRHGLAAHYFLAGYALEHFAVRCNSMLRWQPGGLILDAPDPSPEYDYLVDIVNRIRRRNNEYATRSIYEFEDPSADLTFILHPPLGLDTLQHLDNWQSDTTSASFIIYPSVSVAIHPDENHPIPWTNAYRCSMTSPRHLMEVFVNLYSNFHSQSYINLCFLSHASIWLANGDDLNGLVTEDKADANLAQLKTLIRDIIESSEAQPEVSMLTEGRIFHIEHERIRATFSDILTD